MLNNKDSPKHILVLDFLKLHFSLHSIMYLLLRFEGFPEPLKKLVQEFGYFGVLFLKEVFRKICSSLKVEGNQVAILVIFLSHICGFSLAKRKHLDDVFFLRYHRFMGCLSSCSRPLQIVSCRGIKSMIEVDTAFPFDRRLHM